MLFIHPPLCLTMLLIPINIKGVLVAAHFALEPNLGPSQLKLQILITNKMALELKQAVTGNLDVSAHKNSESTQVCLICSFCYDLYANFLSQRVSAQSTFPLHLTSPLQSKLIPSHRMKTFFLHIKYNPCTLSTWSKALPLLMQAVPLSFPLSALVCPCLPIQKYQQKFIVKVVYLFTFCLKLLCQIGKQC